jgi:trigger factor
MQVNQRKKENLIREYEVKVDAQTIEKQVDAHLQSLSKQVKIAGFRSGHIPMKILKQRYGKSVMGEVLEKTVDKTSEDVIKQQGDRPALRPKIEITSFDEQKGLDYTMSYEVLPEVPALDYAALKVEKLTFEITEEELQKSLTEMFSHMKNFVPSEAGVAAKTGDAVRMDFTGYLNDEAFEGGASEDYELELGSGHFIPGFEEKLEGSKAGDELSVDVTFPESYHKEDLAGKPVVFKVKIHEVLHAEPWELNDELAKKLHLESADALRERITSMLRENYESVSRTKLKKHLFDAIEEAVQFETPEGMVELEFKSIWDRLQKAKDEGEEFDKSEDELRTEYQGIAKRRVRLGLVLAEIGRGNALTVTSEELSKALIEHAQSYGKNAKMVFEFYRNHPEHLDELRGPILEEKVVDFILEKATITERKVSIEELIREEEDEENNAKAKEKTSASA